MKKLLITLALMVCLLPTQAAVILSETFAYDDGSLINVSSSKWTTHSGTVPGQVNVTGGLVELTQTESEDVSALLDDQPYDAASGVTLYASFVLKLSELPNAVGSYIAHFKDATTGFRARVFVSTTNAVAGTYRVGIGNSSGGNSLSGQITTDLELNTSYQIVIRFDTATALSTIWLNPSAETDASVTASDTPGTIAVTGFAFRQNGGMGVMQIDNLLVGTSFSDVTAVAGQPPLILAQPASQTAVIGDDVTFTVSAASASTLSYQWKHNSVDVPLSNPTGKTATLVLDDVDVEDGGAYVVDVTNADGTTSSEAAFLTVNATATAPSITTQPQSATVTEGGSATFTVAATGTAPLSYQWKFGTQELNGQTNDILSITGVTPALAGDYSVRVSNSAGFADSDIATLTVEALPTGVFTNIAYLRTLMDANFLPTDTTTLFTAEGIVTTATNMTTSGNSQFYIQDSTAGIAVFVSGSTTIRPKAGDRVRVTGPLGHFNGLFELNLVSSNPAHTVTTISSGNPLPTPRPLVFSDQFNATLMEQEIEGRYLIASNVFVNVTSGSTFISGSNVEITNEFGEIFILRIDSRLGDVIGQPKPTTAVNIIGVMGQFDGTDPRSEGYQFMLTRYEDIIGPKLATVRFTNTLANLVRPGDQLVSTNFTEYALNPGETITIQTLALDVQGRTVTIQPVTTDLPAGASWNFTQTTGTNVTATFTFTPTVAAAGNLYQIVLNAINVEGTNAATWKIYVPSVAEQKVILSEFLANPTTNSAFSYFNPLNRATPSSPDRITAEDEYVELVNLGSDTIDLNGWTIADATALRHTFFFGDSITSSNAMIIYGGRLFGSEPQLTAGVIHFAATESTNGLALNNNGDTILLRNAAGNIISRVIYSDVSTNVGSLTRSPNLNGGFAVHSTVVTAAVSPGLQNDGKSFSEPGVLPPTEIEVTATLTGGSVVLQWNAQSGSTYSVHQTSALGTSFTPLVTGLTTGQYTDTPPAGTTTRFYRISSP